MLYCQKPCLVPALPATTLISWQEMCFLVCSEQWMKLPKWWQMGRDCFGIARAWCFMQACPCCCPTSSKPCWFSVSSVISWGILQLTRLRGNCRLSFMRVKWMINLSSLEWLVVRVYVINLHHRHRPKKKEKSPGHIAMEINMVTAGSWHWSIL